MVYNLLNNKYKLESSDSVLILTRQAYPITKTFYFNQLSFFSRPLHNKTTLSQLFYKVV